MNVVVKRDKDFNTSDWAGGTTTQLDIYPPSARYDKRDFVWRLSSATVEVDQSDFTCLIDYDRILIVLEGEVKLVHRGIREVCLSELEQECFSGDYETKSYGKIRDFNLMIKKGNLGFAQVIDLDSEYCLGQDASDNYPSISESFYCVNGYCLVEVNGEETALGKGELCSFTGGVGEFRSISVKGSGKVIRACVRFA